MKAVQIVKPNDLRIIDMDKPTIDAKNNVLVKIKAAGICGSDVGIYHGTNAAATYPRVIGHEIVGVVEEVGDNAKKIKVGDRVIVDQVTPAAPAMPAARAVPMFVSTCRFAASTSMAATASTWPCPRATFMSCPTA